MKNNKDRKLPAIGGQAVMEGVMMRNGEATAIAIRKKDKIYSIKKYINRQKDQTKAVV